jgi:hypothetical protein
VDDLSDHIDGQADIDAALLAIEDFMMEMNRSLSEADFGFVLRSPVRASRYDRFFSAFLGMNNDLMMTCLLSLRRSAFTRNRHQPLPCGRHQSQPHPAFAQAVALQNNRRK